MYWLGLCPTANDVEAPEALWLQQLRLSMPFLQDRQEFKCPQRDNLVHNIVSRAFLFFFLGGEGAAVMKIEVDKCWRLSTSD